MEDAPLYNSRIVNTYIKLIKSRYHFVNISELLEAAEMTPYEVADQGHWFSQKQINLFHDRLQKMIGNPDIAREAGRYAASPDAIGVMRQYFLGLVGPTKAYEMVGAAVNRNFVRSSVYCSKKLAHNKVEITVTPRPGTQERYFQCQNRIGFFEAVATGFGIKLPRVEHTECVFKGASLCRYVVSWEGSRSSFWEMTRNATALASLFLFMAAMRFDPHLALGTVVPASLATTFLFSTLALRCEKRALLANLESLNGASDHLVDQININYNNALVTNEVGQIISRQTSIDDILASVVQVLGKRLDFDRGMLLLANEKKDRLVFRAGFGYPEKSFSVLSTTTFHLNRPESQGVLVVCYRDQKPFLVNDVNELEGTLSLRSMEFVKKLGCESFICCPIISEGESIGVLAVDNPKSKRPLVHSDISLLMGIAPMIGISIHNANLMEAKFRQFSSFLKVMAASIDARDPLTAGHSEKVTEYAVGICQELRLSAAEQEMIRVAALLHDYGKIGVPDAILKKNGRLTDLEYEIVKTHSYKTRDILDQVNFEGIYSQVPEIAGAHHERIDGTGYPRGLKGRDIPLGAKIITVADFFEAVTSKRHYRDPMPTAEAYRLLREGSGSHFEGRIVEALISYHQKRTQGHNLKLVQSM
ncbi:HD domain-containing protein [Geomonas sp. RF6]|uniref:HD domain-containing phosphohydrolase n=1 Tax=Geomonas sp. RF6 TaxID=2897342 RepID=UPI001E541144|nr:HD domain-containing phosphohydrolase [Geomonas sp. RF6]UFS70058.1 HD domain-containing protein [Geomonas sp. RF6]